MSLLRSRPLACLWLAVLAALSAAASLAPAPASAANAFYLQNDTGMPFTTTLWQIPPCWYGPTGIFVNTGKPALEGSIRSEVGPLRGCSERYSAWLGYNQHYEGSYVTNGWTMYGWVAGIGAITFAPENPVIGSATLECGANGKKWERGNSYQPIEPFMVTEVDGLRCKVGWRPGVKRATASLSRLAPATAGADSEASYLRFVNSLALVRGGDALVEVESFGLDESAPAEVVLRDGDGNLLGEGHEAVQVDDGPELVRVPLDPDAIARFGDDGEMTVTAVVDQAGDARGDGDSTSRLVLRRAPA